MGKMEHEDFKGLRAHKETMEVPEPKVHQAHVLAFKEKQGVKV